MNKRMFLLALLWMSHLAVAGVPTTQPLAEIASMDELAKQPLIALPTGEKVRLGMAPYDAEQGPWRLVYCRVESTDAPKADPATRQVIAVNEGYDEKELGPVLIACEVTGVDRDMMDVKRQMEKRLAPRLPEVLEQIVPLSRSGDIVLRIKSTTRQTIAEASFHVEKSTASVWRGFSTVDFGPKLHENVDGAADMDGAVSDDPSPVVPNCSDGVTVPAIPQKGATTRPSTAQLPELLKLSLQKDAYVIEAVQGKMTDWPDETLLARWWINGKPLPAGESARAKAQKEQARAVSSVDKMRIAFGLPPELRSCKAGDRIGLQVMYSACGYEEFAVDQPALLLEARSGWDADDNLSLAISNRLEFVLTAEQVAMVQRQMEKSK